MVATLQADDADRNAELEYSVVEPISARDKTGNVLTNRATYDFASAFGVDKNTGRIVVQVMMPRLYLYAINITVASRSTHNPISFRLPPKMTVFIV